MKDSLEINTAVGHSQKILLTGASGFIGSQVLAELLRRGHEVHALVHSGELPEQRGLTVHRLDLLDAAAVESFMAEQQFTHLLHLAWYVGTKCQMNDLNINWLVASLKLLLSFVHHGGEHFLGTGTCSEYEYKYGFMREDSTPTNSDTLYGNAKNSLYRTARIFCTQHNVHFQWTRIFNCYGPEENSKRLISSVILSCLRGEEVRVSHCMNFLDYLHVGDTARGIADVFESELTGAVNICSGKPVQLRSIVKHIVELTGFRGKIQWGAVPAAFDNEIVVGDNHKLRSIGWQPQYGLINGLQDTINYWKEHV